MRCDPALLATPAVTAAIQEAESLLRQKGRLLVRRSGTEPLVRIMAEAEDEQLVDAAIAVVARSLKYTECV
jgi:phosphoglucosamine mutase